MSKENGDLHPGYLRQRRNLMLSSTLLLILALGVKEIKEVNPLGAKVVFFEGNVESVLFCGLIAAGYFCIRVIQYIGGHKLLHSSFYRSELKKLVREACKKKHAGINGYVDDILNDWSYTFVRHDSKNEEFKISRFERFKVGWRLWLKHTIAYNHFTDYFFPILFGIAAIACGIFRIYGFEVETEYDLLDLIWLYF